MPRGIYKRKPKITMIETELTNSVQARDYGNLHQITDLQRRVIQLQDELIGMYREKIAIMQYMNEQKKPKEQSQ